MQVLFTPQVRGLKIVECLNEKKSKRITNSMNKINRKGSKQPLFNLNSYNTDTSNMYFWEKQDTTTWAPKREIRLENLHTIHTSNTYYWRKQDKKGWAPKKEIRLYRGRTLVLHSIWFQASLIHHYQDALQTRLHLHTKEES